MATTITRPQPHTAPAPAPRKAPARTPALVAVIAAAIAVFAFTVWPFAPGAEVSLDWEGPYYWEEISQDAIARNTVAADTFYVDGLERRAAEGVAARLAAAGGPTGYYWEDINRQALGRTVPAVALAEQILEDLSK